MTPPCRPLPSGSSEKSAAKEPAFSDLAKINEPLLKWYRENARELPWRKSPDAYRVWVSEIMLQQTRVETVKPYYERFLAQLPTVEALAACEEGRLLKLWEGLGYYSRVRNMQRCARVLMEENSGAFPADEKALRALPGIGPYTAGAIASIAFGLPVPAVDGNVMRVISRIAGSFEDILQAAARSRIDAALRASLPKESAGEFNQALMDLGATVCLPGSSARCSSCPLFPLCVAGQNGLTEQIPVRGAKAERKNQDRTVLVVRDGERTLLRRRPGKGLLAGLYEPPCMDRAAGPDEVLELLRQHGISPLRIRKLPAAKHIFTHLEWRMTGYDVLSEDLTETGLQIESCQDRGQKLTHLPDESGWFVVETARIGEKYAIPSAYRVYMTYLISKETL